MSAAAREIEAISARLREIAERLRAGDVPGEEADGLAREAADLVSKASNELDRALQAEQGDDPR